MKKFLALLMALVLVFSCVPVSFAGDTEIAYSTKSSVYIDGQLAEVESYIINDQSYFKLRDIAYALVCVLSDKGFAVKWDEEKEQISLYSKSPYSKVGGELELGDGTDKTAVKAVSGVFVDDKWVEMSSYNINGNNYFWLRDIGKAFDFNVYWMDEWSAIFVDTSSSYTGEHTGADDKLYTAGGVDLRKLEFYSNSMDVPEFASATGLYESVASSQTYGDGIFAYVYDFSGKTQEEMWSKAYNYAFFLEEYYGFVIVPSVILGLDSNIVCLLSAGGRMVICVMSSENSAVGIGVYETLFSEAEVKEVFDAVERYNNGF